MTSSTRLIDRLNPRLLTAVTIVGFAIPAGLYFWIVHRYSLNVIVGDQWDDLVVISHSYNHLFDWSSLWAQHNENRILFPNLIVLLLAYTTHFNVQLEEYLSAVMLAGSTALIIWAHRRRSPQTPWLYYCPVAFLAFSLVQYENTLWGFQMAWYLVLLALAVTVVCLDRPSGSWLAFGSALAAAVVGSFSSLQGLLIWPAGLILLYHRRRSRSQVFAWIAGAVISAILYFWNYNNGVTPAHQYAWKHPLIAAKFYLFAVGDIVGVRIDSVKMGNSAVLVFGVLIVVIALATLILYGLRRDPESGSPIGVALTCVGLLFAAIVTVGRIVFGYYGASQSRYTTFDLLIPIGIYLTLLGRPTLHLSRSTSDLSCDESPIAGPRQFVRRLGEVTDRYARPVLAWSIALVIVIQVALGIHNGTAGAKRTYADKVLAANVLRNITHASDGQVVYRLYIVGPASFVRKEAQVARLHHLSLFSTHP